MGFSTPLAATPAAADALATPRRHLIWLRGALVLAAAALGGCGGGHPTCDPHACPSWSRQDPYTCACVDIESASAELKAIVGPAALEGDAGAGVVMQRDADTAAAPAPRP